MPPSHPRPPVHPSLLNTAAAETMWTNLGDWSTTTRYEEAATALALRVGHAAQLGPQDTVVDYACGYGDSLRLWITHFGVRRVVGIEPDPRVCAVLRERIARWGLGDRLRVAEARAESLGPREADAEASAVVCADAAYHFRSRADWWRRAAQQLAPGGRIATADLVVADHVKPGGLLRTVAAGMRIPAENLVPVSGLHTMMDGLGLADVSIERCGPAVLDGFATHVPRRSLALRVTATSIGMLRRQQLIDYVIATGRVPEA